MRVDGRPVAGALNPPCLTPREHEILALLATGKSCQDMALAMGIGLVTVRNHLKRIFPKIRVHSQAEAVAFAFRNKLV